jgi:hypothetical protein
MTPEAQRIAIAGACGLTGWRESRALPDYLNDLNAMHEAVETLRNLPGSEWFDFQQILKEECGSTMNCIQATAAQRAEAFLRTLNLWKP